MRIIPTIILLSFSLVVRPAEASAHGLPQVPQVPSRPVVRPLTRYLAAMLHLTPAQANAVQQALRNCPARTLAPEDLTLNLSDVLTTEAQMRLQSLQNDATTYRALYYLAARH